MKKAYKSVMEGIPVVLVRNSGGFSDVISAALEISLDQVTPSKVIELMEENDLGNKTSSINLVKNNLQKITVAYIFTIHMNRFRSSFS